MRAMEDEALPVEGDYPTGLWWYVGHLDRDGKARRVNNTEVAWTQRLSSMLQKMGWPSVSEQRYPGETRDRCDTVVTWDQSVPWWIEVKGSWKTKFDSDLPNSSYIKHLHATAWDVEKLCSLPAMEASGVSLVLVGFDRPSDPITQAHVDIVRAPMRGEWVESYTEWDVVQRLKFRTRIWAWSKLVTSAAVLNA